MSSPSLSVAAERLLPAATEAPRCAPFTKSIQADPIGTGLAVDLVVLISTPAPWPKPVFDHGWLTGISGKGTTAMGTVRVLASTPNRDNPVGTVHAWWRRDGAVQGVRLRVNSNEDLQEMRREFDTMPPHHSRFAVDGGITDQAVLICTQGSHDICCGADGARLANEAAAHLGPEVSVFRVSHTGGHRFAPTAMTFPDGRMWAWLSLGDLQQVLDRAGEAADLAPQCRGWWGADSGPAQAAERAVFSTLGWRADTLDRHITPTDADNEFDVRAGDDEYRVTVSVGRELPTIACRAAGGLPAKPARELRVDSITERKT